MLNVTLNKNDRLDYTTARAMEEEYLGRGTIFVRLSPVSYIEVNVPNEDIYRIRVVMCRVDLTPLEIERPHTYGEMEIVWEEPEGPAYFAIGDLILCIDTEGVHWADHARRYGE